MFYRQVQLNARKGELTTFLSELAGLLDLRVSSKLSLLLFKLSLCVALAS